MDMDIGKNGCGVTGIMLMHRLGRAGCMGNCVGTGPHVKGMWIGGGT